jgi:hypothetical protein
VLRTIFNKQIRRSLMNLFFTQTPDLYLGQLSNNIRNELQ